MRAAAPHIGVEPCAGTKTDVMGFPRVVVECLLALAAKYANVAGCLLRMVFNPEVQTWSESGVGTFEFQAYFCIGEHAFIHSFAEGTA